MDTKKIFSDVILIPVQNFRDDRGSFKETFNKLDFDPIKLSSYFAKINFFKKRFVIFILDGLFLFEDIKLNFVIIVLMLSLIYFEISFTLLIFL